MIGYMVIDSLLQVNIAGMILTRKKKSTGSFMNGNRPIFI